MVYKFSECNILFIQTEFWRNHLMEGKNGTKYFILLVSVMVIDSM
jgi:hypothetical protein